MSSPRSRAIPQPVKVFVIAWSLTAWGLRHLLDANLSQTVCVGVGESPAGVAEQLVLSDPDVVVFDLDGYSGVEPLSDLTAMTRSKVLALTSSTQTDVLDAAILAGALGVVGKREPPEVFLKAIEKVCEGEFWIDRGATGRILTALARQRTDKRDDPGKAKWLHLTQREREIVNALATNAHPSGKQLAQQLHITEHTLRNHLSAVYRKLGVANRVELYAYLHRHGLLGTPALSARNGRG